ncbi:MAG: hypothetical protein A3E31_15575 [Candidatus Rokubacteria bacterium RIFCSPHIGHO2_12_FULL_73_22]|nr:MAG: hypothetical protein A3D33_20300 [Candidatus Rokubacteria bacterium RIFCSPHIGHO2_02_FULL_73_26]OGL03345.1 MAG: hypothetical protein A3E31_15575 [Candidatus Rokubacteria bacterium RIFCSPHIGHO2_12_FULL_73_22]OGL08312.1 MAG: hypothetical protein A3I14_15880 [Candidatus Rokubacteria bacterium RIFCSPLOWO2_02_FULL_73_56]OGL30077.1 MAG: hypothetical protein A3G44_00290 [Candidatus Rokubacteria bacterium RIFCSPLOWO2_12_FULL_73_47]
MIRVLVPLDGSRLAERALGALREVGGRSGAELLLLRVVAPVNPVRLGRVAPSGPGRTLAARRRIAKRYLVRVRDRMARRGFRARALVRAGDPAAQILKFAREEGVDLIAMSTHGRSGLRRVLFGSVAEAVIRRTPLPLLVVRAGAARPRRRAP